MPLRNPSSKTPVRQLRKTPPLKLNSATEASDLITAVQRSLSPSPASSNHQKPQRRVLAIINPVSGRGVAAKAYSKHIKPILQAAGMILTEATTLSKGHAIEILQKVLPNEFDLILSLGGDGTMFEVLQGVLQRPDWELMSKTITLLQIPCGSGNALAASTGLWDVDTAAHAAVKGRKQLLDIASVVQVQQQQKDSFRDSYSEENGGIEEGRRTTDQAPVRFFSFLSCTYGMLSCLDIGTEHLRWLGGTRFIVGAIQQIIMQHTFKIKVAYLDADSLGGIGGGGGISAVDGEIAPKRDVDSIENGISSMHGWHGVTENVGYGPSLQYLKEFSPIINTSLAKKKTATVAAAPVLTEVGPTTASASASTSPSSLPLLPSGWHWLTADTIQLFAACNLPQLDMNFNFAPNATLNSGHFNLIYTTGQSGRSKGFSLLTAAQKGRHMHLVQERKLKAYWIEPLAKSGSTWLVCDGEEVPHRPLYAEVHSGLIATLKAPTERVSAVK